MVLTVIGFSRESVWGGKEWRSAQHTLIKKNINARKILEEEVTINEEIYDLKYSHIIHI